MALPSVAALPTSAKPTTLPGLENVAIKQERPDEAEIRELAAKMVEANKAKMASGATRPVGQGGQQHIVQPGQPGILNYLSRGSNGQTKPSSEKDKKSGTGGESDRTSPSDEDSVRGRFGWVTLGKCHIPFIFRSGEKYCAVRMVEMKLLNKYLSYLHSDIYSCTCIRSYYITEPEARLLNEVNMRHCESQFGRELFTSKDLVVRLQDAGEFYNFLDVCYNKLLLSSSNPKDKCGFIRINGESVVPYTVRDGFKYVPLFYFEGETDNLKLKAERLEGWDLAYLKFCCKVQGIRNELFASETCSVISLSDIKSYFPPGTVFEDYWPSKVVDSQLLLASNKGSTAVTSAGMWTKQPGLPPTQQQHSVVTNATLHHPVTAGNKIVTTLSQPATQQRTATLSSATVSSPVNLSAATVQAVCNGWAGLVGGQPAFQPGMVPQPAQVIRMSQPPISMHSLSPTSNSVPRTYNPVRPRPAPQYYPQVSLPMPLAPSQHSHMAVAQPPPLVRVTGAPPTVGSSCTYTSSTGLSNMPNVSQSSLHLMGLTDPSHHQMLPPPHTSSLLHSQHSPHYTPAVVGSPQALQRHTPPNSSSSSNTNSSNNNSSKFPPPLIPVNGTSRYSSGSGAYSSGADVIDLSSPPQSPHRPSMGNGRTGSSTTPANNSDHASPCGRKLIQIGETATSGSHIPYQVQKALVEGKMVPCINSKPFIYSELLITLPDLVTHFFPSVPLSSCRQVLQDVLGLDLYRGNRQQMNILRDSGKCQSVNDILPLVQVRDVMQYMPQMNYMFSRMNAGGEENPSKRQRTS
ncbi:hypothetical protein B7P43_G01413 [Cryptotermes secundus]|uniref:Uncharacterized protein n=2 Tax=Cryptotermes secundus TaxID=105785 RepID=A0A2J7R248_9NEOP|nr:hypothetical protein B7P43_G01413 [Cryptotermes secundus]